MIMSGIEPSIPEYEPHSLPLAHHLLILEVPLSFSYMMLIWPSESSKFNFILSQKATYYHKTLFLIRFMTALQTFLQTIFLHNFILLLLVLLEVHCLKKNSCKDILFNSDAIFITIHEEKYYKAFQMVFGFSYNIRC